MQATLTICIAPLTVLLARQAMQCICAPNPLYLDHHASQHSAQVTDPVSEGLEQVLTLMPCPPRPRVHIDRDLVVFGTRQLLWNRFLHLGPAAIDALRPMLELNDPSIACGRVHADGVDDSPFLFLMRHHPMRKLLALVKLREPAPPLTGPPPATNGAPIGCRPCQAICSSAFRAAFDSSRSQCFVRSSSVGEHNRAVS